MNQYFPQILDQLSWDLDGDLDVSVQAILCPLATGSKGNIRLRINRSNQSNLQIQVLNARYSLYSLYMYRVEF